MPTLKLQLQHKEANAEHRYSIVPKLRTTALMNKNGIPRLEAVDRVSTLHTIIEQHSLVGSLSQAP
ncbi:MAG TPA: hypothetical protein VD927_05125 [Chryseosolibacter sp.]|nr:hypothetical protein [Chryseosolibacter sp.]